MKVPDEVLRKIKERATREWPDDYVMQKHEIDSQVEAWLDINAPGSPLESDISEEVWHFDSSSEVFDGKIKWYEPEKEFGFITQNNGEDVFLHASMIENWNGEIYEGRGVKFTKTEGEHGPMAVAVFLL